MTHQPSVDAHAAGWTTRELAEAMLDGDTELIASGLLNIASHLRASDLIDAHTHAALDHAIHQIDDLSLPLPNPAPLLDHQALQTEALALASAVQQRDPLQVAAILALLCVHISRCHLLDHHAHQLSLLLTGISSDQLLQAFANLPYPITGQPSIPPPT